MAHEEFDAFADTIAALRAPDGCPWNREQTHESIAHNMVEEAYEAVDAIESGDAAHLREELGDVLLQVVLQSQIAADAGEFDIDDVCRAVNEKMIRRHPHVFGDARAESAAATQGVWDAAKLAEKHAADAESAAAGKAPAGLLDGVPSSFPALMQAQKISRKAAAVGFDWADAAGAWAKVDEELAEFREASTPEQREIEFGDVLFALVNAARWEGVDAESALRAACGKFRRRWAFMEGAAYAAGRDLADMDDGALEALWERAKERGADAAASPRAAREEGARENG